jgi:hypothetical protein
MSWNRERAASTSPHCAHTAISALYVTTSGSTSDGVGRGGDDDDGGGDGDGICGGRE